MRENIREVEYCVEEIQRSLSPDLLLFYCYICDVTYSVPLKYLDTILLLHVLPKFLLQSVFHE